MYFHDNEDHWTANVASQPDPTYDEAGYEDASLAQFLSRPVQIKYNTWSVGATLNLVFDPWTLFFSDPRVLARINNYNLLRCKLRVKIVINGNGFHYGRAIAAYLPLVGATAGTTQPAVPSGTPLLVSLSQLPHVLLDPTVSQGGELQLPFFYHKNWLHVPSQSWANSAMGDMHIQSFNILKHANGATDSVSIAVFAWAEDVRLCVPTSVQSESDEYGKGIVGRTSSAVAAAGKALSKVPVIGPYAKATSEIAKKVGKVASFFGFSRPIIVNDPMYMKPSYTGNLANTDAPETVRKLTADSKQELCLDPRTVGLSDVDELALSNITSKQSFVTQFTWSTTDITATRLFDMRVNPSVFATGTYGTETGYSLTPVCFASLPFQYWSGTLKYRFQIVASNYHKGRLRFTIDPNQVDSSALFAFNNAYTRIVDVSTERDFEICVSWMQPSPYLQVQPINDGELRYSSVFELPTDYIYSNGVITVSVLNQLVTPNSTVDNDIQINVFVSAGDDFCLCAPTGSHIRNLTYLNTTVESESEVSDSVVPDGAPDSTNLEVCVGEQSCHTDEKMSVFFGEAIVSFRSLLRRYNFHSGLGFTGIDSSAPRSIVYRYPNFPYYRGYDSNAVNVDSADVPYNYANCVLLNYLAPAFLAWRGGIRYKYVASTLTSSTNGLHSVGRYPVATSYSRVTTAIGSSEVNTTLAYLLDSTDDAIAGAHLVPAQNQPSLEVELPFYSPYRFAYTRALTINSGQDFDATHLMNHTYTYQVEQSAAMRAVVQRYVSVGEDFNLFFYAYVPPVFYQVSPSPI
jgi:hypothetical protein